VAAAAFMAECLFAKVVKSKVYPSAGPPSGCWQPFECRSRTTMQARTLLACLAVLQLLLICFNFTMASWVIMLTLPVAVVALLALFIAIYCRWKTGIWAFIFCAVLIACYNGVSLFLIFSQGKFQMRVWDTVFYILQLLAEIFCILLGYWVLNESDNASDGDDEEKKGLLS
jgi:hypothetical protein